MRCINMMDKIKGFIGITVLAPLAGAALGAVGGLGAMGAGMKSVTQIGISTGLMGESLKFFKFK